MLGAIVLGGQSDSGTGRLHWEESLRRPGVTVFMWHNLLNEEKEDEEKEDEKEDEEVEHEKEEEKDEDKKDEETE